MLFILLCFTLLLSSSHSANVLVIAGLRGSHLYVSTDVAEKLAEFGHNVTVLTMFSDNRVEMKDRAFHYITVVDEEDEGPYLERWEAHYNHLIHMPSKDMMWGFAVSRSNVEEVKVWMNDYNSLALKYFRGEDFAGLLEKGKFEMIVLENSISLLAMIDLADRDIPIMGVVPYPVVRDVNDRFGLPGLFTSVPSWTNDVKNSPPTFVERFQTLVRMSRFLRR